MAGGSSRLYRQRKLQVFIPGLAPRPSFQTGTMSYHARPHVTIPELEEDENRVYIPPTPEPPTPPEMICIWDDPDAIWDDTFGYDCGDDS